MHTFLIYFNLTDLDFTIIHSHNIYYNFDKFEENITNYSL